MTTLRPTTRAPGAHKSTVIALHCSGSSGRAWDRLRQTLGDEVALIAPDLIGCGSTPHWLGPRPFRLTHEAAAIVALIDRQDGPVHLVGHSYGGGVALRAALERPRRVASLALYEPTPFHVLGSIGADGRAARQEIQEVADDIAFHVAAGLPRRAARRFIDYWNHAAPSTRSSPRCRRTSSATCPRRASTSRRCSASGRRSRRIGGCASRFSSCAANMRRRRRP